jgi:hypothetical protein
MAAFQFYLQSGKQRNTRAGKQFPGEKLNLRWCVGVMQQLVLLLPKFEVKYLHMFTQLPQNVTVLCGIGCLAYQDEFFWIISLTPKKMMSTLFNFVLHLCPLLRSALIGECQSNTHVQLMLSYQHTCPIIARVSVCRTFSKICTTFDAVPLSDKLQNGGSSMAVILFSRLEPLLFLLSSYSIVLMRLSGSRVSPDPLLLRKSGSTRNRIRICSQELWPLDHRGSCIYTTHENLN